MPIRKVVVKQEVHALHGDTDVLGTLLRFGDGGIQIGGKLLDGCIDDGKRGTEFVGNYRHKVTFFLSQGGTMLKINISFLSQTTLLLLMPVPGMLAQLLTRRFAWAGLHLLATC